jgi:hypothetical protein
VFEPTFLQFQTVQQCVELLTNRNQVGVPGWGEFCEHFLNESSEEDCQIDPKLPSHAITEM